MKSIDSDRCSLYWTHQSRETISQCKIFSVERIDATNERLHGNSVKTFYTLIFDSWVNVIPLTSENKVILVEQFRHGVQDLTLEIPGGSIDDSDNNPLEAARRELIEETGFTSDDWSLLGSNHPNPAVQDNLCFTYLARNIEFKEEPRFDGTGTEQIQSRLVDLSEINTLIKNGIIHHSLVITAFHFLAIEHPELF